MTFQGYQWAAGHNQAGSLVNVETDVTKYLNKPFIVQGRGRFNRGIKRPRADFGLYITGVAKFSWLVGVMSGVQYDYIQDTYTVGNDALYGLMTVRTMKDATTFANYNCTLWLPDRDELSRKRNAYENVVLQFQNAVAI